MAATKKNGARVRIALLEDDPVQAEAVTGWFAAAGHDVHALSTVRDAIREASRESFDLFLIDWTLPDSTGEHMLRWLREERGLDVPVIFITARDAEEDVVTVLNAGADDYMVKPLRRLELLSRVEAVMRRARPRAEAAAIELPPYRIDPEARNVSVAGEAVELTDKEFELALFLFRNLGRLVSRGHLLEAVWGRSAALQTRTIDTHVSRVRNKLRLRPENGFRLSSTYSYGYRLERLEDRDGPPA
jgi:DNA-binding response OmpR family regulator